MIGLIVCTHGKFSEELVRSSEMMFGKQQNLQCVTFEPGESADGLVEKYQAAMTRLNSKDGILFLVDLFGGSPYNSASRIVAAASNMDIVTGVNLPMLLGVYESRATVASIAEVVDQALQAGSDAVKSFQMSLEKIIVEEL